LAIIGVVYLYRFAEGEGSARAFLESYRAHPAGIDHDLHVILKGFPDETSYAAARALFGPLSANLIELDDTGYDIGSYLAAARRVANDRLVFLNTFSEILADDWLGRLDAALNLSGVGLVGATGSWQSLGSGYAAAVLRFAHWVRHPIGYVKSHFEGGAHASTGAGVPRRSFRDIVLKIRGLADLYEFGRYPNPHIRTNAFMIDRERFLSLASIPFRRKADVYKFESGRRSMTNQILRMNLKALVVDRSGRTYDIDAWRSSSTFWVGNQENLMVADNMTRKYALGSSQLRQLLENYAWQPPTAWPIWPRASARS
jgi:hypothetical protein